jgi:LPS-assembly lipoprotein
MKKNRRLALALSFSLAAPALLAGCGFRLRGSGPGAMLPFKTVYLGVAASPLATELKRNIVSGGDTLVVDDPKAADATLEIVSQGRDKKVLSLNSQGRVREYTLVSRLIFQVKDAQGKILLAPTEIAISRVLSFNESQVLAKEAEEASLYREMQSDLVQQVMRRLAAIKPA